MRLGRLRCVVGHATVFAVGKQADLIPLDAKLLENISNTQRVSKIRAVGVLLQRKESSTFQT
jgi:hypothetical protein